MTLIMVASFMQPTIREPTSLSLLIVRIPSKTQIIRSIDTQSISHQIITSLTEDVEESTPTVASGSAAPHLVQTVHVKILHMIKSMKIYANVLPCATGSTVSSKITDEEVGSRNNTNQSTRTSSKTPFPYEIRAAILGPFRLLDPFVIASLILSRNEDMKILL